MSKLEVSCILPWDRLGGLPGDQGVGYFSTKGGAYDRATMTDTFLDPFWDHLSP